MQHELMHQQLMYELMHEEPGQNFCQKRLAFPCPLRFLLKYQLKVHLEALAQE